MNLLFFILKSKKKRMSNVNDVKAIYCPCGWATESSPRESDGKFKIHLKRCEKGRIAVAGRDLNIIPVENSGMTRTRNGNIQLQPIRPSLLVVDGVEVKTNITLPQLQRVLRK